MKVVQEGVAQGVALVADRPQTDEGAARLTLEKLLAAHGTWFDVERDRTVSGRTFPGLATFHEQGERYVLSRKAKLWQVATNEYVFFDVVDRLTEDYLAETVRYMKEDALPAVVQPHPDHMFSNLSLVIIADAADEGIRRAVRRVRYRKNFKWGFWGWSDLRVGVIDLSVAEGDRLGRVMTNAAGKALRDTLANNRCAAAHYNRS